MASASPGGQLQSASWRLSTEGDDHLGVVLVLNGKEYPIYERFYFVQCTDLEPVTIFFREGSQRGETSVVEFNVN